MSLKLDVVKIDIPEGTNVIVGQAHFIKTVEDLYEALVTSSPHLRFGLCFSEASGKRLVRKEGNDEELTNLAVEQCLKVGAGHIFFIYIKNGYPINILNQVKSVQEVVRIFAATANPLQVIVAHTDQGRGIVGVVDGQSPLGVEDEFAIEERKTLLRKFGYKR
ncbi:adenosine monophosphate-protein transferase [Sulfodiicoccus acidiphilus]|uniref:Adenosine monophosphate-protein transferase n=1 Tax=Sulfodiicoccus acidiphilus TaxID=1670455 RepID=A0A348B0U6_9CREN|nr:adenosine-specific kinase [Sulfodiicoccus acidiphilus]BBD71798.1 adenosine monophosphate-protein transferase [Sulfodiicoccus acidiphilus]GGT99261.1 adenosine monophosphate-protein transferase [Sulfodiicoccus acidiphilus]